MKKYYIEKAIWGADKNIVVGFDNKENAEKFLNENDYCNYTTKPTKDDRAMTEEEYGFYY